MDHLNTHDRSALMARVRRENTEPETVVRSYVHRLGYRFRLHDKKLPGTPDIVFRGRRKVIFVHGCFWHGHTCRRGRRPASNQAYWQPKLDRNMKRDQEAVGRLAAAGWDSLVIWECELRDRDALEKKIIAYLEALPDAVKLAS